MLKDFKLITYNSTTNTISFSFKPNNEYISGSENSAQRFVKRLLTAKNSNAFNGDFGSNFFHLFKVVSKNEVEQIKGMFPVLIQDLFSQTVSEQNEEIANGVTFSDEEILTSISLESVDFDEMYGGWLVSLVVQTKAGNAIKITI